MARRKFKPITIDDVFERLTVIGEAEWYVRPKSGERSRQWFVRCECGNEKTVHDSSLKSGHTQSCGCLQREMSSACSVTHDATGTPEWKAWANAKGRCYNPNDEGYANYGGRGIAMYGPWLDDPAAFIGHVGPKPSPKHSLGRIKNDGDYEPGNVRWETDEEQQNNRRSNHWITAFGKTMTLAQWSRETGVMAATLWKRLHDGRSDERTVSDRR
mgnify:CR=1 FL=1